MPSGSVSQSILSDLGMDVEWDEGTSIPVANVENKYLEEEVSTSNHVKFVNKRFSWTTFMHVL